MHTYDRKEIASLIYTKITTRLEGSKKEFSLSKNQIGYFFIDDLLPLDLAHEIFLSFPKEKQGTLKKSLKEHKYVAAQMNKYNPLLEEVIFAFQDKKVVNLIGEICDLKDLHPDKNLYAGGISMMREANFLNPHLDNSHDKDRNMWRVLNLLYYVTPSWDIENGGNLELWPNGPSNKAITIHSKFNRLIIMATHNQSWHSVSPVTINGVRCCVSNYYFSQQPLVENSKFHVTTFRGRPEQKLRNVWLSFDSFLRMQVRKLFKKGIIENPHKYHKKDI